MWFPVNISIALKFFFAPIEIIFNSHWKKIELLFSICLRAIFCCHFSSFIAKKPMVSCSFSLFFFPLKIESTFSIAFSSRVRSHVAADLPRAAAGLGGSQRSGLAPAGVPAAHLASFQQDEVRTHARHDLLRPRQNRGIWENLGILWHFVWHFY